MSRDTDYYGRAFTDVDFESVGDYYDMNLGDLSAEVTKEFNERLEYEILGAWRAGYDFLHVYEEDTLSTQPLGTVDMVEDALTFSQYVLPSNNEHPIRPDGVAYAYTYDLTSVPDHVMRAAARGELDKYERINTDQ